MCFPWYLMPCTPSLKMKRSSNMGVQRYASFLKKVFVFCVLLNWEMYSLGRDGRYLFNWKKKSILAFQIKCIKYVP